jgi:hypothetical protein
MRELDSQENTLMSWEDDLAATERALGRVRMECDIACNRAKAGQSGQDARLYRWLLAFPRL